MAISLNSVNSTVTNHETRIKALESKGASSWTKGSNSVCNWAKDSTSGLLIMWSKGTVSQWGNITLPYRYSSTSSFCVLATQANTTNNWTPQASDATCRVISVDSINIYSWERIRVNWITIGYLISDRILNYIYKAFAIIFTLIFGIRLVSKFTV